MTSVQTEIINVINNIPPLYQSAILEYANYMKGLSERGEQTDMEYFSTIPGMIDSIKKSAEEDLSDCSDKIDL